jgi:hypothetical protein
MRLTHAATRPQHGRMQSHEPLYEQHAAQRYDEEALKDGYRDGFQAWATAQLSGAAKNDSISGQRTPHPTYSKRETSRLQKRDWPRKSFVSSLADASRTYTRPLCPFHQPLPFTQVRCHALSTHCVASLLIVHCHSLLSSRAFFVHSHNNILTLFFIRCQSTFYTIRPLAHLCTFPPQTTKTTHRLLQVN